MKQDTFAKKMGITQQNVSKMEKKEKVSEKKIADAAKILGTTVKVIKEFNEKAVFNSNIAFEENSGQTNNINSTKEIIEYFKDELSKKDIVIQELMNQLKAVNGGKDGNDKSDNTRLSAMR